MTSAHAARVAFTTLAVTLALVVQTTVFPHLLWRGVGPDLVLLVVVAAGLARGSHFGMVIGFGAGVLVDLAPPSDHVAGRWALALLVVGYVAGRVRPDALPALPTTLAAVAACSFLGSSLFALSGLVLADTAASVPDLLDVVLTGVVWDVVVALLLVPVVLRALDRLEPDRLAV